MSSLLGVAFLLFHISGCIQMTRIVLPGMLERGKGAIINIASMSALKPSPMLTVYAATKAYADFFSVGLREEYADKGIIVQSVLPGFVATNMSQITRASLMAPFPKTYVRSALATVGVQGQTFGYWPHALTGWIILQLPDWIYFKTTLSFMKMFRAKHLRKQQKKAE